MITKERIGIIAAALVLQGLHGGLLQPAAAGPKKQTGFVDGGPFHLQDYLDSGKDPAFLRIRAPLYHVRSSPDFSSRRTDNIEFTARAGQQFAVVPSQGADRSLRPMARGVAVRVYAGNSIRWIYVPNKRQDYFELCNSEACAGTIVRGLEAMQAGVPATAPALGCGEAASVAPDFAEFFDQGAVPASTPVPPPVPRRPAGVPQNLDQALKPYRNDPICRDLFGEGCRAQIREDGTKGSESLGQKTIRMFPQIRALVIEKVRLSVPDPALRERMVQRLKGVRFVFNPPECRTTLAQTGGPSYNLQGGASGAVVFCPLGPFASSNARSEFLLAQVLAHELSHSIDPCMAHHFDLEAHGSHVHAGLDSRFPIPKVLGCLRGKGSLRAGRGTLCAHEGGDQIQEAFADWMGNEVAPEYIEKYRSELSLEQRRNGYLHLGKVGCMLQDGAQMAQARARAIGFRMPRDPHPDGRLRINQGLLLQPKVRDQLGCGAEIPAGRTYCSSEGPGAAPGRGGAK